MFDRIAAALAALFLVITLASPSSAADEDKEYVMTSFEIKKVQDVLYELIPSFKTPNGKMNAGMRAAVREFQTRLKFKPTGVLTKHQFEMLAGYDPASLHTVWGSVSASVDGKYAEVHGMTTRVAAHQASLAGCKKVSRFPGKCTTLDFHKRGNALGWASAMRCGIVAYVENGKYTRYSIHLASQMTKDEAIASARGAAKKGFGYSLKHCETIITIAADGSV